MRERQTEQREKQTPWREPDVELDPGSPGSAPGLTAALNPWAIRAVPIFSFLFFFSIFSLKKFSWIMTMKIRRFQMISWFLCCQDVDLPPWNTKNHLIINKSLDFTWTENTWWSQKQKANVATGIREVFRPNHYSILLKEFKAMQRQM